MSPADPIHGALRTALAAVTLTSITHGDRVSTALRIRDRDPETIDWADGDRYQWRDAIVSLGPPAPDWAHSVACPAWRAPFGVAILYPSGRQAPDVEAAIQADGRALTDGLLSGGLGGAALRAAFASAGYVLDWVRWSEPPRSELQEPDSGPPVYVLRLQGEISYRS